MDTNQTRALDLVSEAGVEAPPVVVKFIAWVLAQQPDVAIQIVPAPKADPVVLVDGRAVILYV